MRIKSLLTLLLLAGLILSGCTADQRDSPTFRNVLISCSSANVLLEERESSFNFVSSNLGVEEHGSRYCEAGEDIKTLSQSYKEGKVIPRFEFNMQVTRYESSARAEQRLSQSREIRGHDQNLLITESLSGWTPSVAVDELEETEVRYKESPLTGTPSVGYQLDARIGAIVFTVSSEDYGAYIGSEEWPIGFPMITEARNVVEGIIRRYQTTH
jgi:hypothetical protein